MSLNVDANLVMIRREILLLLLAAFSAHAIAAQSSEKDLGADCRNPQWQEIKDQSSIGARKHVGPLTVQDCLDFCAKNTSCLAVDVNVDVYPPGCWPHYNQTYLLDDNLYHQTDTNQFRLTTRCSNVSFVASCNASKWERYRNVIFRGASRYVGPRTIRQCLDHCDRTPDCVAVDIDVNLVPLKCWVHTNKTDLQHTNVFDQPGSDHYRLMARCPNNITAAAYCYNPEWEVSKDQISVGASQYTGAKSVQECLDYCGSQKSCVAVDVNLREKPPTCWPHFSKSAFSDENIYDQPGSNQYRLIDRCANGSITDFLTTTVLPTAGGTCRESVWRLQRNHVSLNGTQHIGPRTIQQCRYDCERNPDCLAVDVDVNVVPVNCWLHTTASNLKEVYYQTGSNQYRLIRRCQNITKAPGCYNPVWSVLVDQSAVGATQVNGPQSVQECLDHCGARPTCVAVDINLSQDPPTCWPHFERSALNESNMFDQSGTNQYRLANRCANGSITEPATTTQRTTTSDGVCRKTTKKKKVPTATLR